MGRFTVGFYVLCSEGVLLGRVGGCGDKPFADLEGVGAKMRSLRGSLRAASDRGDMVSTTNYGFHESAS